MNPEIQNLDQDQAKLSLDQNQLHKGTIIIIILKNLGTILAFYHPEKKIIKFALSFVDSCVLNSQIPNSHVQNKNREI